MAEYKNYPSNKHGGNEKTKHFAPVTKGVIVDNRPSGFKRVMRTFITEDAPTISKHVLEQVIIPAIKHNLTEILNIVLYGDSNNNSYNGRYGGAFVNYGGYYTGNKYIGKTYSNAPNNSEPSPQIQSDSFYSYEKLAFPTRQSASAALCAMQESINIYGSARVSDLFDLADVTTNNFTFDSYGWTDLSSAKIIPDGGMWYIKMPKCSPIFKN